MLEGDDFYEINLFQDDFHGNYGILSVSFPNKEQHLLGKVMHMLIMSLVFLLIITFGFGATLQIIYRQKKISELKTEFINNMTHELKTPVATISLASQMLQKPKVLESQEKIENYSSIIKDENDRLSSHIEKVLQFAKIDRGDINLDKKIVDIHELIESVVHAQKLRLTSENIELNLQLSANYAKVFGDKDHLSNIIFNLLDNAIKYRKEDAKIDIYTQNVKNGIKFAVSDNGIGISKDALKKIFDKFYRVPTGNIHDVKGFGLGLSYVKQMVDIHKGTIEAQSELNKGSTFTVFLPTA
jgi:two-component system phosphate regulon sensor histidine kinase PhoR